MFGRRLCDVIENAQRHPRQRRASPPTDQRHPRLLQGRGGIELRKRKIRLSDLVRSRCAWSATAGARGGISPGNRRCRADLPLRPRGRAPAEASPAQPAVQCDEVHRDGRRVRCRPASRRRRPRYVGRRHRHRHRAENALTSVWSRSVRPKQPQPQVRGDRPRSAADQGPGRAAWRPAGARQRSRRRHHSHRHPAGIPGAAASLKPGRLKPRPHWDLRVPIVSGNPFSPVRSGIRNPVEASHDPQHTAAPAGRRAEPE